MQTIVERILAVFLLEVFGARRKDIIRLIIESPYFPQIAEFHDRDVMSQAITAISCDVRSDVMSETATYCGVCPARDGGARRAGCSIVLNPLDVRSLSRVHLEPR